MASPTDDFVRICLFIPGDVFYHWRPEFEPMPGFEDDRPFHGLFASWLLDGGERLQLSGRCNLLDVLVTLYGKMVLLR